MYVWRLSQFQCVLGKHWIEFSVFGKNGERFPTTDMLLFSGGIISTERTEHIRAAVVRLTHCTLSSESEERVDPDSARLRAREAVGQVRTIVDKGRATIQYNIRYGFFRNLMGGVIWSAIGSACCSIYYGMAGNWLATALFSTWAALHLGLFTFRKPILTNLALAYGDTLFTEFLNHSAKECRHCDIR